MNVFWRMVSATAVSFVLIGLAAAPSSAKFPKIGKKGKGGCTSFKDGGTWQGYLHTDKGEDCALPETIETLPDRDWMFLRFTDYQGPKLRLAVMKADNRTGYHDIPIDGLEAMLADVLFSTQRFELVERLKVGHALDEQDFGKSGRVAAPTAVSVGNVLGADYLIFATVVEWVPEKSKIGGSGGKRTGYWRKKTAGSLSRSKAEVAMNFQVIDAKTSTILNTLTTRASATNWGLGAGLFGKIGGGFGNLGFSKNTPISYAVQAAMAKAAYQLAHFLVQRPWRGSVTDVIDNIVVINAGSDQGIERNMMLTVLHKGREVINPDTGQSLGTRTEVIGTARITTVEPSFSEAAIVDGCKGVKSGDRVEILDEPARRQAGDARASRPASTPDRHPSATPQVVDTITRESDNDHDGSP